jgi:hypothetical protein
MAGQITIQSPTRNNVRFIITWDNGSAGVYTGSVDEKAARPPDASADLR